MKYTLYLTFIFSLIGFGACRTGNQERYTLSGKIRAADDLHTLLLVQGDSLVDSIAIDEQGSFSIHGTAPEPELFELVAGSETFMLVLQNGETAQMDIDLNNPQDYRITGSETSVQLKTLHQIRERFRTVQETLQTEFEERLDRGDDQSDIQSDLIEKHQQYTSELSADLLKFAEDNEENLAGFLAVLVLYSSDPSTHEEAIVAYTEQARKRFPNNDLVQSFAEHMDEIKPLSIGQTAPDFRSTSPEGKEIKLSDLRGQYVLLDFWAAWCTPCRQENPNIVAQYHDFKDKGFTVFGVSLDRDRSAWLKAIQDDKLEWTQVSDLQMWDSPAARLYQITAIPASFMIDPKGKIVGKNLRGQALKEFLEQHL